MLHHWLENLHPEIHAVCNACSLYDLFQHVQEPNEGDKGSAIPWAQNHNGSTKKSQQCLRAFFNTVHLFPKTSGSNMGTKLAFCPGHHLTLLRS